MRRAAESGAGEQQPASLFRIPTMDCAAEESEIRRALEPLAGIRSLGFQLSARTVSVDAPADVMPAVIAAIRHAGFDPRPVVVSSCA